MYGNRNLMLALALVAIAWRPHGYLGAGIPALGDRDVLEGVYLQIRESASRWSD